MAQAKLEIEIVDNGGSAVGAPPPAPAQAASPAVASTGAPVPPVSDTVSTVTPPPPPSPAEQPVASPPPADQAEPSRTRRQSASDRPSQQAPEVDTFRELASTLGYGPMFNRMTRLIDVVDNLARRSASQPANAPPRSGDSTATQQASAPLSEQDFMARLYELGDEVAAGRMSQQEYERQRRGMGDWPAPTGAAPAAPVPAPQPPIPTPGPVAPGGAPPTPPPVIQLPTAAPAAPVPATAPPPVNAPAAATAPAAGGAGATITAAVPAIAAALLVETAATQFTETMRNTARRLREGAQEAIQYLAMQSRQLSQFSGPLASATAHTDIRQQQAEMNRASEIGPLLAKFETDRSRMTTAFYDMGTGILKILLKMYESVRPIVEVLVKVTEITGEGVQMGANGIALIVDTLKFNFGAATGDLVAMRKHLQNILNILQRQEDVGDPLIDDFTQEFLGIFNSQKEIKSALAQGNKARAARMAAGAPF